MVAREKRILALLFSLATAPALMSGCEYVLSDIATRIRYALLDAKAELQRSQKDTLTITLRPNHAPDGCQSGAGYRVVLSPYRGNKQVVVGDIDVYCNGSRRYYTGFGSEQIYVTHEMAVEKKADDEVHITLHRTSSGIEIVGLE
jgi:hypothetical protein